MFDTIASHQGSDGGMIAASEMNELHLPRFMTLWTMSCLNRLAIWLVF